MKFIKTLVTLALFSTIASLPRPGQAQSLPTATQSLQLSAFGAATGTFTRFEGGKNAAITAGVDLTWLSLRYVHPSIEVRGTYPVDGGNISSQKSILAGIKVEHAFGSLHPYADFLLGRGEIDYHNGSGAVPCYEFEPTPCSGGFTYLSTTTNVYSPGVGLDLRITRSVALKADAQFQFWKTPLPSNPSLHPVALSFGGVYYFNFNPRHHRNP
jgi:hypothetical protein